MQCGAGARPEWVGKRLVAVKRMKKKWEGGWDECKKLKELEVSDFYAFLASYLSLKSENLSRYGQYHFTPISSRYTTFFYYPLPRSYISFSNPWKGTSTILLKLGKGVHWQVALLPLFFDKSCLVYFIYTHAAISTVT
jgi:hypothetical protein